jgi:fatty acid desaturase
MATQQARADRVAAEPAVDWPTIGLTAGIYLAYGLVTWHYQALPWWIVMPLAGAIICTWGSLQHEVIHGYPTPWRWVNEGLVYPSLWLWLPYRLYRDAHLKHHCDELLTSPSEDPESYYVGATEWAAMGPFHRRLRGLLNTLAGRLVIGPFYTVWRKLHRLADRAAAGDRTYLRYWVRHLPGAAIVVIWAVAVCRIPFGMYLLLFVYPAISLTLLRSFAEHRATRTVGERTAVIESGRLFGLLYLYNNLHILHHLEPGTAWYRRPARYRLRRNELLGLNGHYVMRGYRELFARYLLQAKEPVLHPFLDRGGPNPSAAPGGAALQNRPA